MEADATALSVKSVASRRRRPAAAKGADSVNLAVEESGLLLRIVRDLQAGALPPGQRRLPDACGDSNAAGVAAPMRSAPEEPERLE